MNLLTNLFYLPTDEWGDDAVRMTNIGVGTVIIAIIALIVAALIVYRIQSGKKSTKITAKQLTFSAMAVALAVVTSMIKIIDMPMGGSVTLFSMLFIVLIGYWYGPFVGIVTGMAYGLIQFVLEPIFYTIPQMLVDYPLAFGALGLSGFFAGKKRGLALGYIVGVLGRYVFAFLSGVLFFAAYAPEEMGAVVYSLVYNGSYLLTEGIITLIIICLPPMVKAMERIRQLATEE